MYRVPDTTYAYKQMCNLLYILHIMLKKTYFKFKGYTTKIQN